MVYRCSVCNRPVAGHRDLGCAPGPGNCTLSPIPLPAATSGGSSATMSPQVTSAPSSTTASTTSAASQTPPVCNITTSATDTSANITIPSIEIPSSSQSLSAAPLTNEQMQSVLEQQVSELEVRLKQAEAKQTLDNIYKLYDRRSQLQARLDDITGATGGVQSTPNVMQRAPPATTVTWSVNNPFIPPATNAGVTAASFGATHGIPAISQSQQQGVIRIPPPSQSLQAPSAVSSLASPSPSVMPPRLQGTSYASSQWGAFPPNLSQSSQLGFSLPNLHNGDAATASFSQQQNSANLRGSLFQAQSLPDIANSQNSANFLNMAALNPSQNPFASSEEIFEANPLIRAILGVHNDAREESAALGKYIPELFALRFGSINEIRSKMSYPEFMQMYTRMLIYMLRDDPHLVPDRLIFLHNLAKKAARYRWQDVREIYAVAMHELKIKRRRWADDWKEITEDTLEKDQRKPPLGPRPASGPSQSRNAYVSRMVSPLDASRALCADFNDRSCHRPICKFHHECAKCGGTHARQFCTITGDPRPPNPSHHHATSGPSS